MMKITVCVFLLVGVVYTLPMSNSLNQRYPVEKKKTNDDLIPEFVAKEELATPPFAQDLIDSSDPDGLTKDDENLEPAESRWGRRFGGWGGRYGGWGRRYGGWGYGGFGPSIIFVPRYYGGWGRGFGGYGPIWGGYW